MRCNKKKAKRGITLIALVITIIVLLILAGITISTLTGENGILTKANEAKVKTTHTTVFEDMQLEYNNYKAEKLTGDNSNSLIEYLTNKEIITPENEEEGIYLIHVEKMVGEKLPLGNGTNGKDVYKLEEIIIPGSAVERDYKVMYYGKNEKENKEIGTLTDNNGEPFDSKLSPGLYKEGTSQLIKSWDELLEDGDIVVEDGIFKKVSSTIGTGKLIISRDITEIQQLVLGALCGDKPNMEYDCEITSVYIPSSVKTLDFGAFGGFEKLKTVVIEEGLEEIRSDTFNGCSSLENINLPNSIKTIQAGGLFKGCNSLKSVTFPNCTINTYISEMFENCTNLESVKLPEKYESNGYPAQSHSMFEGCQNLNSVVLPDGMISIGTRAFDGCSKLSEIVIPDGMISIGERAFDGCSKLSKIVIPDGVTEIQRNAFFGCSNLSNIEIPDTVTTIGKGAFDECSNLTNIEIPARVTTIGAYAFHGCSNLTNITIPNGVTSIGDYTFYKCSKLKNVNMSTSITEIGELAFYQCDQLENINLPNGVTKIGKKAFYRCSQLSDINIPTGITEIYEKTFGRCVNLASITIPKNVTKIDSTAFMQCNCLKNIQVNGENTAYDSRNNCNAIIQSDNNTLILGCANTNIPSDVTAIGPLAFADNDLTEITIPARITSINGFAFAYCDNLKNIQVEAGNTVYDSRNNCKAVIETNSNKLILGCVATTIPNDVTAIGDASFSGATSLIIPSQITSISWGAFSYCDKLKNVQVDKDNTVYDSRNTSNIIVETSSNRLLFACGETTLPESLKIPAYAFINRHNTSLKKILIPASTNVQYTSFTWYEGLESVTFQEGEFSVPISGFTGCESLVDVTIPKGVNAIGNYAFSDCENLSNIIIPDGVTSIDIMGFQGCGNLKEVNLPRGMETIGDSAFAKCNRLKRITRYGGYIIGSPWGAKDAEIYWME